MTNKIDLIHFRILSRFVCDAEMVIEKTFPCNCGHCEEVHIEQHCPCGSQRISGLNGGNGESEILPSGALHCGRCGSKLYTREMLKKLRVLSKTLGIKVRVPRPKKLQNY